LSIASIDLITAETSWPGSISASTTTPGVSTNVTVPRSWVLSHRGMPI